MVIHIKSNEALRLARELSELTGESLTTAVTEAIRERLQRVQSAQEPGLANRLLRIGKDCAEHLKEPLRSADHKAILYDDTGLP